MKILFDLTYVNPKNHTGVSVYAQRLMKGIINSVSSIEISILSTKSNCEYFQNMYPNLEVYISNKNVKDLNAIILKNSIKLYFLPFLTLKSIIPSNVITVGTIHDLQPLRLNSYFKNLIYKRILYLKLKELDGVITISDFSKECICDVFPNMKNRVNVIYNSVESVEKPNTLKCKIDSPYILNVNAMEKYKNQMSILKAFALICDRIPHKLIFKGKENNYWNKDMLPFIKLNKLSDRVEIITDNFSDEEMAELYSSADLFVNTSLMEGFGFTPIEAAIYKTPVLTSKNDALPEITKEKLNYIDNPNDEFEISKKILELLNCGKDCKYLNYISNYFKNLYSIEKQTTAYVNYFMQMIK